MTTARRFLVLVALMFWLGGFTFYAAVVVPIGTEILGSASAQGFVTRVVTNYLNLSAAIGCLLFLWDSAAVKVMQKPRLACCLGIMVALAVLVWLHPRMEELLDPERERVLSRSTFGPLHRTYLWVSTAQWAFGAAFALLTVLAWRKADRSAVKSLEKTDKV